jgi:multidrug efflux pump subunit AcrA (membrane-fusion protein)
MKTRPRFGTTFAFLALLLLGGLGGYVIGKMDGAGRQSPGEREVGSPSEKKVKYWVAPMDPTYVRNEPGKSPMGMDLIPVYEGDEAETIPGSVKIDPTMMQNIGVRTATVQARPIARRIRTVGVIDYDERRVTQVQTKVAGWIEKLHVDFTGQAVENNAILAELYSPELISTQEEYLVALDAKDKRGERTGRGGVDSLLRATREKLDYLDIPLHQIQELEQRRSITKTLHIHASNPGVVVKKYVQEGSYVKPGMPLYTVADLSRVWVYADIYEYELPWLRAEQEAIMTLSYYPGEVWKGTVSYIYPYLESKTRTVKVRLEFDNPGGRLKPAMYANIVIQAVVSGKHIAVPVEAVIRSGERNIVVVSRGEGRFLSQDVRLGVESGDNYYQVLDGLTEGDIVVTSAQFLIDSESRLQEAVAKMLEPKAEPGAKAHQTGMHEMGKVEGHGGK